MSTIPSVDLGGDVTIPQLGLGVFQMPADETERVVPSAFEAGYRHIDTAAIYGNEEGVGRAIAASGPRARRGVRHHQAVERRPGTRRGAGARSTASLGGWAWTTSTLPDPLAGAEHDRYLETWEALLELQQEGRARAIGVSNFQVAHLERLIDETGVCRRSTRSSCTRACSRRELRALPRRARIATEAWSPLAQGATFADRSLAEIAEAHGKKPGAGDPALAHAARQRRDPEVGHAGADRGEHRLFDFELSDDDLARIAALDGGERTGFDPDTFG